MSTKLDWSIIEDETVAEIVLSTAGSVGTMFSEVTTVDDMEQEALLIVASEASRVRGYLAMGELGNSYLYRWLYHKLYNMARTDAARAALTDSLDA